MIDKYFSSENLRSKSSRISKDKNLHSDHNDSKMLEINEEIHNIKKEKKNGVEKLVDNINSAKELKVASSKPNNPSELDKQNSEQFKKQKEMKNLKIKIMIGIVGMIMLSIIFYLVL